MSTEENALTYLDGMINGLTMALDHLDTYGRKHSVDRLRRAVTTFYQERENVSKGVFPVLNFDKFTPEEVYYLRTFREGIMGLPHQTIVKPEPEVKTHDYINALYAALKVLDGLSGVTSARDRIARLIQDEQASLRAHGVDKKSEPEKPTFLAFTDPTGKRWSVRIEHAATTNGLPNVLIQEQP